MVTALLFTEGDWRHKVYKEEITLPVASLIALLVTIYTIFVTKIKIHSTNFFYFLNFHREWSVHHLPWLLMIPLLTSQFWHTWHLADRLFFHSKSNIYSWLKKGHPFGISSLLLPLNIFIAATFFHCLFSCIYCLSRFVWAWLQHHRHQFVVHSKHLLLASKWTSKQAVSVSKKPLHRSFGNLDMCKSVYFILLQQRLLPNCVERS